MNDLFSDIAPIPDCEFLIDGKRFKSPSEVAREMLRECRVLQNKNQGKDVIDVISPDWKEYIKQNL